MHETYLCGTCGLAHDGMPKDYGWQLPDVVWNIPAEQRPEHATFNSDLCQFRNRFFIRCVLATPFAEQTDSFAWGIWVELAAADFHRYRALYDQDARMEPPVSATIANEMPAYPESLGLPVWVQFADPKSRPSVRVQGSEHALAREQSVGIDNARYHEILRSVGHGD